MIKIFKDKTLLVTTFGFPNKTNSDYGEIFVKEQIKCLKDYFKEIIVISPTPQTFGFCNFDKMRKDYIFDNVKVYFPRFLHLPINYCRKKRGDNEFKVVDRLIKKKIIKFDLIHSHFSFPSGYVGMKMNNPAVELRGI